jgi:hypothetical protein
LISLWYLYVQLNRHTATPLPDAEATLVAECKAAGVDPELVGHLLLGSAYAPKDARRVTEMARKAQQWMSQYRKNWSNVVRYSQMQRAIAIAMKATEMELSVMGHWNQEGVMRAIHRVDRFVRTGYLGGWWGFGFPTS